MTRVRGRMTHDVYTLPPDLPVPVDDGAADHLLGTMLPQLTLESSQGPVSLRELGARAARALRLSARRPARAAARRRLGRDSRRARLHAAVVRVPRPRGGAGRSSVRLVAGLSAQTLDDQLEFAERNHIPYPVIADPELRLGARCGCRRSTSRA